jgi:hypothetical protein
MVLLQPHALCGSGDKTKALNAMLSMPLERSNRCSSQKQSGRRE